MANKEIRKCNYSCEFYDKTNVKGLCDHEEPGSFREFGENCKFGLEEKSQSSQNPKVKLSDVLSIDLNLLLHSWF